MGNAMNPITTEKALLGKNTDELTLLENELVPVYTTSTGEKVVYGKDLHRKLKVKTDFST